MIRVENVLNKLTHTGVAISKQRLRAEVEPTVETTRLALAGAGGIIKPEKNSLSSSVVLSVVFPLTRFECSFTPPRVPSAGLLPPSN